ncbi:MAG: hypothetical protein ACYDD4_09495 [Acidimicrobiales bacterium]
MRARKTVGGAGRAAALGVWRFFVGDTPEFLVAALIAIGFAFATRRAHVVIDVGLPALVVAALVMGVRRGRRRAVESARERA